MNRDELRQAILRRADMVGSPFVSDDELDTWIDIAVAELHGVLREKYGDEYFSKTTWIQVRPGTDPNIAWPRFEANVESSIPGPDTGYASSYPLPDDFLSLVRLQYLIGTVTRATVKVDVSGVSSWEPAENWTITTDDKRALPMRPIDTAGMLIDFTPRSWRTVTPEYRLRCGPVRQLSLSGYVNGTPQYSEVWRQGSIVDFLPPPTELCAVQATYVRTAQLMPDHPHIGYVICGVAAMCLGKQQQDPSALLAEQGKVVSLITGPSATKDAANPKRVVDIRGGGLRRRGGPWPYEP